MKFIATEFNLTIFKTYTLNRKIFTWNNFESLTYKNFTPFNSQIFLFATLYLFEVSRNISGNTLFSKTLSKTMKNFSLNMQGTILKVNMLYFISAIVKI